MLQFKGIPMKQEWLEKERELSRYYYPSSSSCFTPSLFHFLLISLSFLRLHVLPLFPFCSFSILPPSLSLSLSLSLSYSFNFFSLFSAIPFSLSLFHYIFFSFFPHLEKILHCFSSPFFTHNFLFLFVICLFLFFFSFRSYSVTSCSFIYSTSFIFL